MSERFVQIEGRCSKHDAPFYTDTLCEADMCALCWLFGGPEMTNPGDISDAAQA